MPYPYQSVLDTTLLPKICELGPFLNLIDGIFRVWMIYHFSDPNRIVDNNLKDKIWNEDPTVSQITIEAHDVFKVELTENRPAIVIKRGKWTGIKLGIGDRRMGELTGDGSELYVRAWQGYHTLFCIGGTPGEANILACEAFKDLNEFAQTVRRALDLKRLEVSEVGEYAILEESGKNYVVPITVGYVLEEAWITRQEAPFLKRLDLTLMGL